MIHGDREIMFPSFDWKIGQGKVDDAVEKNSPGKLIDSNHC